MTQASLLHDNTGRHRFEIDVDGQKAIAAYELGSGVIVFTHTEVPPALRGHGLATKLVEGGLAAARERGLKVVPSCSVFADYMKTRPDTHALLAPEGRALLGV